MVSFNEFYKSVTFSKRNEWLNARRRYIGASDASSVLGINPWKSKLQLYKEKRDYIEGLPMKDKEVNADITRGQMSEKHIRELYAIEHPEVFVQDGTGQLLVSNDNGFMSCTLDASITSPTDGTGILEIKSVHNSNAWKDSPPLYYVTQMLHQLAVTHYGYCILLARRLCQSCVVESTYRIDRMDVIDDINRLVEKECSFWNDNVLAGREPSEFTF